MCVAITLLSDPGPPGIHDGRPWIHHALQRRRVRRLVHVHRAGRAPGVPCLFVASSWPDLAVAWTAARRNGGMIGVGSVLAGWLRLTPEPHARAGKPSKRRTLCSLRPQARPFGARAGCCEESSQSHLTSDVV